MVHKLQSNFVFPLTLVSHFFWPKVGIELKSFLSFTRACKFCSAHRWQSLSAFPFAWVSTLCGLRNCKFLPTYANKLLCFHHLFCQNCVNLRDLFINFHINRCKFGASLLQTCTPRVPVWCQFGATLLLVWCHFCATLMSASCIDIVVSTCKSLLKTI